MNKPFMSIRMFDNYDSLRKSLSGLDVTYKERPFFSEFWGIKFHIDKPCGKGSQEKIRKLQLLTEI